MESTGRESRRSFLANPFSPAWLLLESGRLEALGRRTWRTSSFSERA